LSTLDQDITLAIQGCLSNNRKAQELLYRLCYSFAAKIAMRYSRDDQDAADILSHAFVKVFKHIHQYDAAKGSFYAWLKRIVVNEGLDHIKSRNRFDSPTELDAAEEVPINHSVIEQMEAGEILQLVQKLPPTTHAVFVLYAVEGYNHREIGEKLNISEGTSKWYLSEARKSLQQMLSHYPR
jgi:RNA polymerase sigma-70 factor (ECF subfamily)